MKIVKYQIAHYLFSVILVSGDRNAKSNQLYSRLFLSLSQSFFCSSWTKWPAAPLRVLLLATRASVQELSVGQSEGEGGMAVEQNTTDLARAGGATAVSSPSPRCTGVFFAKYAAHRRQTDKRCTCPYGQARLPVTESDKKLIHHLRPRPIAIMDHFDLAPQVWG